MTTLDDLEAAFGGNAKLHAERVDLFGSDGKHKSRVHVETDDELIERAQRAKGGGKFARLWAGDIAAYDNDDSRADQALANDLVWWCDGDTARADRLFRRSALYRPKWDEVHFSTGETYGQRTIGRAYERFRKREREAEHTGNNGYRATVRAVPEYAIDPSVFSGNRHHAVDSTSKRGDSDDQSGAACAGGFIGRYVRYAAKRTDAPIEAHQLMAAVVLSALAGQRPRLPIATVSRGMSLILWALYIVDSTFGRKTTVLSLARNIVAQILGEDAVLDWEGSQQGIIQRLQDRDGCATVLCRDELSGLMGQMNRTGGHLSGLEQLFIRGYDGLPIQNIRTRKKVTRDGPKEDDSDYVRDPYLVLLTASTYSSFIERTTIDNVLSGLLARFAIVSGIANPKPMPRLTPELGAEEDALVRHAGAFHEKAGRINLLAMDDDVFARGWELEQEWARAAADSSHPAAAGPALKRLADTVLKLAGLLAIDASEPGTQPVVTVAHFNHARALAERWKGDALRLIEVLGSTTFMKDIEAVLATVRARPSGIATRDLMRQHRRIRQRDLEEILNRLQEEEQIEIVKVDQQRGGWSRRIVYSFGTAPKGE